MITITGPATPEGWVPLGNGIKYKIKSTMYYQPGFYFLVDVYINNTNVITLRKFPITGDTIEIDLKDVAKAYCPIDTQELLASGVPSDKCQLYIVVTEYYSGESQDTATSVPLNIWNAVASFQWEKNNSLYSNYLERYHMKFSTVFTGLNNEGCPMGYHKRAPKPIIHYGRTTTLVKAAKESAYNYGRGMNHIFGWFNFNYEAIYKVMIGFDASGVAIKKAYTWINNPNEIYLYSFNTTDATGWAYKSGTFSDWSGCKYFAMYLASSANEQFQNPDALITEPVVIEVCDANEYYAVAFKSKDGGWGIVQCNSRETETTSIKLNTKEDIKPSTLNETSRLRSVVAIEAQRRFTLHTDWVDEGILDDIRDMIVSPIQYIIHYKNGSLEYIPVIINDAEYITNEKDSKKLLQYTFIFTEAGYQNTL